MKDSIVLDIETLGSVNNCVVLSVGMVAVDSTKDYTFEELIENGYYAKLDVKSQVDAGRKIYKDTLARCTVKAPFLDFKIVLNESLIQCD